jgi:PAS domain S-box-containing protein
MEQAPSGIIIAEAPSGKIIYSNEEADRIAGYAIPQVQSYQEYDKFGGLRANGTLCQSEEYPLARALLQGEVVKQEIARYKRADGSLTYHANNAAPIYDNVGKMIAAIVTFHDVTNLYELERKKDEFISMASHELRAPLTAIKGHLQLSERRLKTLLEKPEQYLTVEGLPLVEKVAEYVSRGILQVNLQNRLVSDLLDVTRVQTGKLNLIIESHNLIDIVTSVVADRQTATPTRDISLELPDQCAIPVMVDRMRIGQTLSNYLTNALKYSPETAPVVVGVTLEKESAHVWVRDQGPGLDPEVHRKIWDRFYQVPGVRDNKGSDDGGLGLGLNISQSLIEQHGGVVGVESELGKGSTFWFRLPTAYT